jgi:5-methylcytosine-specific restriction endonuclease McrA
MTTDVGTTKRKNMTPRMRLKVWERHKGVCCLCGIKIDGTRERWIVEHIRALELGGEDVEENMGPAHEGCAIAKTGGKTGDHARAAKAKRAKSKHLGIKKTKNPLPGGKGSKWKKKIDGGVVPRD